MGEQTSGPLLFTYGMGLFPTWGILYGLNLNYLLNYILSPRMCKKLVSKSDQGGNEILPSAEETKEAGNTFQSP